MYTEKATQTDSTRPTGRFAPSPTGRMHLGNVFSALMSWLSVKSRGGQWILRIEDLDPQRSKPEYARQIEDDLLWLGLTWDAGGTASGEYVQSNRSAYYQREFDKLQSLGLLYPCYCSRTDIMATQAPHESDGRVIYRGTCRPDGSEEKEMWLKQRAAACPHAPSVRICVPDETISFTDGHYGLQSTNLTRQCGDFIIRRADGAWAYQLAVVTDDALMHVTEVVRGRDLLLSVAQQLFLYRTLGYPVPSFCHLPLLCNESGQRLSKRDASMHLGVLREKYSAQQLIGLLAHCAGLIDRPAPLSAEELLPYFDWNKIPTDDITIRTDAI